MKNITCLLCFTLFIISSTLVAEMPVGGSLRFYSGFDSTNTDFYRNAITTNLDFKRAMNKTTIFINLEADYDTAQGSDTIRSLYGPSYDAANTSINSSYINSENQKAQRAIFIKESYINQDFHVKGVEILDSFSLRAGKIITKWGFTEYFNPVDVINPQDYSFNIMTPDSTRKRGVYAIYPSIYFSRYFSAEGFINPIFEADNEFSSSFTHKNTKLFSDSVSKYGASYIGEARPTASLSEAAYGSRAGLNFSTFQGHLMYYRGYDHSPTYLLNQTGTDTFIRAEYKQLNMVGIDFLSNLVWDINLKGECAYFHTGKYFELNSSSQNADIISGGSGHKEAKLVNYTTGFEIIKDSALTTFLLNFEYNQNIIIDHKESMNDKKYTNKFISELQLKFAEKKAYIKNSSIFSLEDKDLGAQFELGLKPEKIYVIKAGYWMFHKFGKTNGDLGAYDKQDFIYFAGDIYF